MVDVRVLGPAGVWRPGRPIPPRHRLETPLIALDDPFEVQLRLPAGVTDLPGHLAGQRLAARLIVALHGAGGPPVPAAGALAGPWIWSIPPRH